MDNLHLATITKSRIIGLMSLLFWSNLFSFFIVQNPNKNSIFETTDHIIVVKNNTVTFDYLEQAEVGGPVQLRVINTPEFGVVKLNEDQSFSYTPTPNLCEANDVFTYLLTTESKTFEVTVSIEILCESLTIYNGIANHEQDKALEKFKILGVENFPQNTLHIFDTDGNEIYKAEAYKNDWNGKADSSEHLVKDNLYYYVFSDGEGNYYSGYLKKD